MADLAQSVEHQIVALVVAGSNPVVRPLKSKRNRANHGFFFYIYTFVALKAATKYKNNRII